MERINLPDIASSDIWDIALLVHRLKEKSFGVADLGIPHKTYHDWRNVDVVPPEHIKKNDEYMELKFTFYEWLWFQILRDLRELGVSFKNLSLLRDECWALMPNEMFENAMNPANIERLKKDSRNEKMFKTLEKGREKAVPKELRNWKPAAKTKKYAFEFMVMECIFTGREVKILLRHDGRVGILTDTGGEVILNGQVKPISFIEMYNNEFAPYTHLSIPLNRYLKNFYSGKDNNPYLSELGFVNEDELEVLNVIKRGDLKELTIKFNKKEGKIKGYEFKTDKDLTEEEFQTIMKTFYLKQYESVSFKRRNNKMVYFEKTVSKPMNEKE